MMAANKKGVNPGGINGTGKGLVNTASTDFIGLRQAIQEHSRKSRMKKIVLTGPESSGKTTIAKRLAMDFNAPLVTEYARTYLDGLNRPYQQSDLKKIAQGQVAAEKKAAATNPHLLICDTDLWTILIWSEEKYNQVDPYISTILNQQKTDLYLLLHPTLPWRYDPQRENPTDRDRLFQIYRNKLRAHRQPYLEIDPTDQNFYKKIRIGLTQV